MNYVYPWKKIANTSPAASQEFIFSIGKSWSSFAFGDHGAGGSNIGKWKIKLDNNPNHILHHKQKIKCRCKCSKNVSNKWNLHYYNLILYLNESVMCEGGVKLS